MRLVSAPRHAAPGTEVDAVVRVTNTGDRTDRVALTAHGLAAGWVALDPPEVTVLPGVSTTAVVHVRVPPAPVMPAGPLPVSVRATSRRVRSLMAAGALSPETAVVAVVDLTVIVEEMVQHRLALAAAPRPGWRRGRARLAVTNTGNALARIDLVPVRPVPVEVSVRMDPRPVVLEPGATTIIDVRLSSPCRWRTDGADHLLLIRSACGGRPDGRPDGEVTIPWRQRSSSPVALLRALLCR